MGMLTETFSCYGSHYAMLQNTVFTYHMQILFQNICFGNLGACSTHNCVSGTHRNWHTGTWNYCSVIQYLRCLDADPSSHNWEHATCHQFSDAKHSSLTIRRCVICSARPNVITTLVPGWSFNSHSGKQKWINYFVCSVNSSHHTSSYTAHWSKRHGTVDN